MDNNSGAHKYVKQIYVILRRYEPTVERIKSVLSDEKNIFKYQMDNFHNFNGKN